MKALRLITRGLALAMATGWLLPYSALACPACYGAPDSPMQQGMNMGIVAMLGVTGMVLGGFGGFIVYLARRARHFPDTPESQTESLDIEWLDGKEKVQ
jgi:hypothetical protein